MVTTISRKETKGAFWVVRGDIDGTPVGARLPKIKFPEDADIIAELERRHT